MSEVVTVKNWIRLRGKEQPKAQVEHRYTDDLPKTFVELLAIEGYSWPEPMIEWDNVEQLAAVDVDFHSDNRPPRDYLLSQSGLLLPTPNMRWVSHGGGLRAIFFPAQGFAADECAALYLKNMLARGAAFFMRGARITSVELCTRTRHPKFPRGDEVCSPVLTSTAGDPREVVATLLGEQKDADPAAVAEWLEQNGWESGQRYDHERCLIDPEYPSHGQPVWVGDGGIVCLSCKSHGKCYAGYWVPGFIPFTVLIDPTAVNCVANPIRQAVYGLAHWEHARHIAEAIWGTGPHVEPIYRALLKLAHVKPGDSPEKQAAMQDLIRRVFFPEIRIAHCGSDWFHTTNWRPMSANGKREVLQDLPAVKYVREGTDRKGKVKVELASNTRKLGLLLNNGDLSEEGFPPLKLVRGVDFGWSETAAEVPIITVVPAVPPFRFYGADRRDMAWVQTYLDERFPGVRLDVLKLLVAAKGIAQKDPHEPPRIFIKGASGSSKTAHVTLAAELACEGIQSMRLTADLERSQRLVIEGTKRCLFQFIDEVDKAKLSAEKLTQFVLSVSRGVTYHQLHVGNAEMEGVPAICFAGCELPKVFRSDRQLARRVVFVNLESGILTTGKHWNETAGEIVGWRARESDNARAADMLVSEVMDRYRGFTFERIAEDLGFASILKSPEFDIDVDAPKREFFKAVCESPETTHSRWVGRHWRTFQPNSNEPLAEKFRAALDAVAGDFLDESATQPLVAAHWGEILGVPKLPITCDFDRHGSTLAVRFRRGKLRSPVCVYNGDCVPINPA